VLCFQYEDIHYFKGAVPFGPTSVHRILHSKYIKPFQYGFYILCFSTDVTRETGTLKMSLNHVKLWNY